MASMIWRTAERRIGVVGMYNSGKTVFLTSLIDHLMNHDPARFRLGQGADAVTLRRVRPEAVTPGWEAFNFRGYRNALATDGRWPRKTRDRSEFACRFERSDWRFNEPLLRLYDMPGERLADAAMFGAPYADWSDHWQHYTENDTHQREASAAYLGALNTPGASAEGLIDAYRLALATSVCEPHFKPFVSPSTFLLDAQGTLARGRTPGEVRDGRYAGLDAGAQFAPLPRGHREANPELRRRFEAHYDAYQEAVVRPFIEALATCHSLVVLVDVAELLRSGVGMANDNRQMVRDLLHVIEPGETLLGSAYRRVSEALLQRRPHWVSRVAFVAPKIDCVHPQDRDRVLHLLRRHVGSLAGDHDGLRCEFFVASAIVSTKPVAGREGERLLKGMPVWEADHTKAARGEERHLKASAVPEEWPERWRVGDYAFPEVYPVLPAYKAYPPDQIGLDRVLDFVLD